MPSPVKRFALLSILIIACGPFPESIIGKQRSLESPPTIVPSAPPAFATAKPQPANSKLQQSTAADSTTENNENSKKDPDSDLKKEIESARSTADELKVAYDDAKRLFERGSASQTELRRANLAYKLAMLDVIELESPDSKIEVTLARARLELEVATKELEVIEALYRRGAASELEFQRATSAYEIAELGLQAVEDGQGEKFYKIKMAQKNVELAEEIMLKAERLYRASSISETVYENVKSSLGDAEDELALAKKELGVQVRQVPAEQGTKN